MISRISINQNSSVTRVESSILQENVKLRNAKSILKLMENIFEESNFWIWKYAEMEVIRTYKRVLVASVTE